MRCKAGDLAVITGAYHLHPNSCGALCRVLYRANSGAFTLPDGAKTSDRLRPASWVIEAINPIVAALHGDGKMLPVKYAVCPDSRLRPLRDNPGQDETLDWAPVPHKEAA